MTFCPSAVVWGDLATWVSAVGAFVVGVAVVFISHRTNSLANAANRTNHKLQQIEECRDREQEKARSDRRTLALASIGAPIGLAKAHLEASIKMLSSPASATKFWSNPGALKFHADRLQELRSYFPDELDAVAREVELSEGARLIRAAHAPATVSALLQNFPSLDDDRKASVYAAILIFLNVAAKDLRIVHEACVAAEDQCGMRDVPTLEMLRALQRKPNS